MTSTVHVIARITARTDTVADVRALLRDLLEPTRQEPGCRRYTLLHNPRDPTDFTLVEEWADAAALDAHFTTPHLQTALALASSLLAATPDIRQYAVIG